MICQGRLVSSLIFLVCLSACGSSHTGWNAFPVPITTEQSQITESANFQSDFQDAMTFWNEKAGKQLFDYRGNYSGSTPYSGDPSDIASVSVSSNVLMTESPWPFDSIIVGQTFVTSSQSGFQAAMVMINPTADFCSGDCDGEPNLTSERKVLAHELGHFLGLQHVTDIQNLMYPSSQPGGSLADVTIDETTFQSLINTN
jgi:hypothetical protein